MTWREYHDATRHSVESLRQSRHFLDWANMPDPFRHYEGVPVLDLPANPSVPDTPALEVLRGVPGATSAATGPAWLSQLLFYSAAISASKLVPATGYRYALRVNPSSGNLHPTEFHFRTRGTHERGHGALRTDSIRAPVAYWGRSDLLKRRGLAKPPARSRKRCSKGVWEACPEGDSS